MRRNPWRSTLAAWSLAVMIGGGSLPAYAQQCRIRQITRTNPGWAFNIQPAISGNGHRIAFVSNQNLAPNPDPQRDNRDGNAEIFLYDQDARPQPFFLQVTASRGDGRFANSQPSISRAGNRIAFVSSRNLTPELPPGNTDENPEIFVAEISNGPIPAVQRKWQITRTTGGANLQPSISGDGQMIAFVSDGDLVPPGNRDGNQEIFLARIPDDPRQPATIIQITYSEGGSNTQPSTNEDGSLIAFISDRDLSGGNPDKNPELFLARVDGTNVTIDQLTDTPCMGASAQPSINAIGDRIAFVSNQDLTGENPNGATQLFLWDAALGIRQLTRAAGGFILEPSLSADGQMIAFVSDVAPDTGQPLDSKQIFVAFNLEVPEFMPITNTRGGGQFPNAHPAISAAGEKTAFVSNRYFLSMICGMTGAADKASADPAGAPIGAPGVPDSHEEIFVAERPPFDSDPAKSAPKSPRGSGRSSAQRPARADGGARIAFNPVQGP